MTTVLWITLGLLAWTLAAVPLGLLLGALMRGRPEPARVADDAPYLPARAV